jgi:homoserine O-acetyltransferase/O-succinyltransferase
MSTALITSSHQRPEQNAQVADGIQYFSITERFVLESGQYLDELTIAFQTFGTLNEKADNVVWIIHALTANTNPESWWPGVVGKGLVIDPDRHFIVCANCIGSPYGSTSPLSINPATRVPYFHDFPLVTQRDVVKAFDLLRSHLGIDRIQLLVGASLGGQQVLEWSILAPQAIHQQLLLATNARHSAWGIAFNESQRLAIYADPSYQEKSLHAGAAGLKAARSIALLSYRTVHGYNRDQTDENDNKLEDYRAASYQRHQGDKLVQRFDAFSYIALTRLMDSHHVGRSRGSITDVLGNVKVKTHIVGISTDLLFPLEEQKYLYAHIPNSKLHILDSALGHDGFLTEAEQVGRIIRELV